MARPLRIEFPGAVYHLTARGNARQDIYLDDTDRCTFLDLLDDVFDFLTILAAPPRPFQIAPETRGFLRDQYGSVSASQLLNISSTLL